MRFQESWRVRARQLAILVAPAALAACGAGVASVVAASSGSDSGDAAPVLTAFEVVTPKVSPTPLRLVASQPVRVALFLDAQDSQGQRALTHLEGLPGNEVDLPAGETVLDWDFAAQLGPGFTPLVQLFARRPGGATIDGGEIALGPGNDPPVIQSIAPPAGESSGVVPIGLVVSDTSADVVSLAIEWRRADEPADAWKPARAAGVFPPGVVTSPAGAELTFFWDTDVDLADEEHDVVVRVTGDDRTLDRDENRIGVGEPVEGELLVDNNAAPIGIIEDGLLAASSDQTRAIAIPFTLLDDEGDEIRAIFQWRKEGQAFPALPTSVDAIEELLADPEQRREHRICTEQPLSFTGRVQRPPSALDPTTHVGLPELSSTAAGLLARGVEGRTLEILRASHVPERLALADLGAVVAAHPVGSGPTALVLEASGGSWRLRELDLATGLAVDGREARGSGEPTAMDGEPDAGGVVVASLSGGSWRVARVDLASWVVQPLVSVLDGVTENGRINGILALGTQASLITVGSSLVRLDYPRPGGTSLEMPRATMLLSGLATPWGLVADPLHANRIYLAERDFENPDGRVGRVVTVELDTYIVEEVFTLPSTPRGAGLERPTGIALERNGARLLAVTDGNGDQVGELRGVNINGNRPGFVFELARGLPPGVNGLAAGPDELRILACSDGLWLGGGVTQQRTVMEHDPKSLTVSVVPPFSPPPEPGASWRIRDLVGVTRSSRTGTRNFFVWDSGDAVQGTIHLRLTPLDTDVGTADEGLASKVIRRYRTGVPVGGNPAGGFAIVARDLNGDGRPDLALELRTELVIQKRGVELYHQRPDGTFPSFPVVTLETPGFSATALKAADVDDDHLIDLLVPDTEGLQIFLQPDDGFVNALPDCSLPFDSPARDNDGFSLVTADLDRDGLIDLATTTEWVSNPAFVHVSYQGSGPMACEGIPFSRDFDLEFGDPGSILRPLSLASGDVDGDGNLDLVVGSNPQPGPDGTGFWSAFFGPSFSDREPLVRNVANSSIAAVADLNRDGRLDVVSTNRPVTAEFSGLEGESSVSIFLQSADLSGSFDEPGVVLQSAQLDTPFFPVLEDLDGNGTIDLATANETSNNVTLFEQSSSGAFGRDCGPESPACRVSESVLTHPDLAFPFGLAAEDLHGTGRLDLIASDQGTGKLIVFEHGTPGRFARLPDVQVGTSDTTDQPVSLAGGDLDGDGLLDLVSANDGNRNLTLFLQESPGRFSESPSLVLPAGRVLSVCCADLDGDADLELVSASFTRDVVQIFEQRGPGTFAVVPVALGSSPSSDGARFVAAADLDGDGALDVLAANRGTTVTVFLNKTFRDPEGELGPAEPDFALGSRTRPRALAVADLEPDGDLDVVSANEGTSNLIVYRNDGPEGFRTDVSLGDEARTPDPRAVIAADLDADGLADIASANHGRVDEVGSYIVFFQDAGRFASPPLSLNGFGLQRSLAAADLDGDGDLDLVTADSSDSLPDRPSNRTAVIGLFAQTAPRIFSLSAKLGDEELGRPAFVSAADWNADGEVDLAAALHGNPPSRFFAISDKIGIFFNGK